MSTNIDDDPIAKLNLSPVTDTLASTLKKKVVGDTRWYGPAVDHIARKTLEVTLLPYLRSIRLAGDSGLGALNAAIQAAFDDAVLEQHIILTPTEVDLWGQLDGCTFTLGESPRRDACLRTFLDLVDEHTRLRLNAAIAGHLDDENRWNSLLGAPVDFDLANTVYDDGPKLDLELLSDHQVPLAPLMRALPEKILMFLLRSSALGRNENMFWFRLSALSQSYPPIRR